VRRRSWPSSWRVVAAQAVTTCTPGCVARRSVKSWWVTLDVGALYSNEIVVQPGDAIFGNMTRLSGGSAWFIDSVVQSTGKHTSIKATANQMGNNRLANQPWAYVTLECYGESRCRRASAGAQPGATVATP